MIDDNVFNDKLYRSEYEVCAFCGSTHANDTFCITQLVSDKTKLVWICDQI